MTQFKITIWELTSKGREQILNVENFNNREDAAKFISEYESDLKPYKMNKGKIYHAMEG